MGLEEHRQDAPKALRFAVITISDTRDAATDRGGPFLADGLASAGHVVTLREIVRDERSEIESAVRRAVAREDVDLVLTTGGTGLAPRDVTFDTLRALFDSEIPGFGELFRWLSFREIGAATLLSRAIGGLLSRKVVLALPGSPRALKLALEEIVLREAGHLVAQARGPRRDG
ncbi:MAG: MogA/MoaB family molybdenum cofactor biosynthesis protein [Planctomycetes bacterium]|nr:MogA/MoaB family molybdenum cofactor biosynthesis protein [Planctomycetota bacterium]